jgi:hypothetical protein
MPEHKPVNFKAPPHAQRAATARRLGDEAGQRCRGKADEACPGFSGRAFAFLERYARERTTFNGEDATNAAKQSGIRPSDDRAFGPIYAKLIRDNVIRVVAFVPRVKGHGSMGGKVYAAVN